ncbi:hypothetical protein D3C71_1936670 [compost metagenome]
MAITGDRHAFAKILPDHIQRRDLALHVDRWMGSQLTKLLLGLSERRLVVLDKAVVSILRAKLDLEAISMEFESHLMGNP